MTKPQDPIRSSRAHLETVNESYFEHMGVAFGIGSTMIAGGLACLIHGVVPGLLTDRGSRTIRKLGEKVAHRSGKSEPTAQDWLEFEI